MRRATPRHHLNATVPTNPSCSRGRHTLLLNTPALLRQLQVFSPNHWNASGIGAVFARAMKVRQHPTSRTGSHELIAHSKTWTIRMTLVGFSLVYFGQTTWGGILRGR